MLGAGFWAAVVVMATAFLALLFLLFRGERGKIRLSPWELLKQSGFRPAALQRPKIDQSVSFSGTSGRGWPLPHSAIATSETQRVFWSDRVWFCSRLMPVSDIGVLVALSQFWDRQETSSNLSFPLTSSLAAGLYRGLGVYRQAGFLGRLKLVDWLVLAGVATYVIVEFVSVWVAVRAGKHPTLFEIVGWPVDPLLWALVGEALLLHRSAQRMGPGRITKCWRAFSLGAFLIFAGDLGLYMSNFGYLPWPWSAVIWYIWLPAACTFALAPAYQLEAMWYASTAESPSPGMPTA